MPRLKLKHEDSSALDVDENMSDARVIYIDQHETVSLNVEMDTQEAWQAFNKLPHHVLPPLPPGYAWAQSKATYSVIKEKDAKDAALLLIIYGPDKATHKINFLFSVNGKTTYSFAHTKDGKGPEKRQYPMSESDYRVIGFNYKGHKFPAHVRGHLIDHQDTIINVTSHDLWSTMDPRNYVPEPPAYEWGLGFRNQEVRKLRKVRGGSAYAQLNMYPSQHAVTCNGTAVPEDVKFIAYNFAAGQYTTDQSFNIEFDEMFSRPTGTKVLDFASSNFGIDVRACPIVAPYSPDSSERKLRLQRRHSIFKLNDIKDGTIRSRFQNRDSAVASYEAAAHEFETAGSRLTAAERAWNLGDEEQCLNYFKRSLLFADRLTNLDGNNPYTNADGEIGELLFSNLNGEEGLTDHLRSFSPFG